MDVSEYINIFKHFNYKNNILKNNKNISTFLFNFIFDKNSKIIQIGNIDKETELYILNNILDKNNYIKIYDNKFDLYKIQQEKNIIFDTLIISYFNNTYDFLINYFNIFKEIKYVFFFYNHKTKLCNAVRYPFFKLYFNSLLKYFSDDNNGAIINNKKIKYEILKKGNLKGEIGSFKFSYGIDNLNKTSIINHLIHKYKFNNYLEIGIADGLNFNKINIQNKYGIDPIPSKDCKSNKIFYMTSDEYFDYIKNLNILFDIILIDGSKDDFQVTKDINNSLNFISNNGLIIIPNINPINKSYQRIKYITDGNYLPWSGTMWKSFVNLRMNNKYLEMRVLNCEMGLGIIKKGKQKCYKNIKNLKYNDLDNDRENMLNLISTYEFLQLY